MTDLRSTSAVVETLGRSNHVNVFVHSVTSIGNLAGVNLDDDESHRALLFARNDDVVVVPSNVDRDFLDFMIGIGVNCPVDRIVVAGGGAAVRPGGSLAEALISNPVVIEQVVELCADAPVTLNPFIATEVEWRLARLLENRLGRQVRVLGAPAERVRHANMKHITRQRAAGCGVHVAPGETVQTGKDSSRANGRADALASSIEKFLSVTGRVVVKGSFGASGSSTFIVDGLQAIEACVVGILSRTDNDCYIVEPLFDIMCSPNIVMWIDPDDHSVSCISTNDQCIDRRLVFAGSTFPSRASLLPQMIEAATRLAINLRDEGFSGAAGFDFCEYTDAATGNPEYFLSEINARMNGGMYATGLMERVNAAQSLQGLPRVRALRSASAFVAPTTFAAVREKCAGLLFDPLTGAGVIPFNPGRLASGKVALASLGGVPHEVEGALTAAIGLLTR